VGDAKKDLGPDRKRRCDQPLEGDPHGPLHGILQGHDTEVGFVLLYGALMVADVYLLIKFAKAGPAVEEAPL
jgi:hypothetical protein